MSLEILKKNIKDGNFSNFYIFYGEEDYLKDYYLKKTKSKVVTEFEEFNFNTLEGKNLNAQTVLDSIENCPLMSEKKLIVITDIDAKNSEALEFLAENAGKIPEHTVLILYFTGSIKDNNNLNSFFKKAASNGAILVEFSIGNENELTEWVARHFKSRKHYCDNKTIKYMLSITDNKMSSLKNEIDKICNYCINENITKKEIDAVITHSLDAKIFELTGAITSSDYEKAFIKLSELIALNYDEIVIVSSIYSAFIKLVMIKSATLSKETSSRVMKDLSMKEYPYKLALAQANKLSEKFLSQCIDLCINADISIKSYTNKPRIIIENLIGKIFLLDNQKL